MRIIANIHMYPPYHNAGGETYAHRLFKELKAMGHEVEVWIRKNMNEHVPKEFTYDGINVEKVFDVQRFKQADLIVTHLDETGRTQNYAKQFKKPLLHLIHNDYPNIIVKRSIANQYLIYNSRWVKKSLNYQHPSKVLCPVPDLTKFQPNEKQGEFITLINCNENKGGKLLIELAKANPEKLFLGVLGGYGKQIQKELPNLVYAENTPEIQKIYKRTKVLIMPSKYESYGRTALEAMACGIPVIHSGTEGLKESTGHGETHFCTVKGYDVKTWSDRLESLEDAGVYRELMIEGFRTVSERESMYRKQVKEISKFIEDIVKKKLL